MKLLRLHCLLDSTLPQTILHNMAVSIGNFDGVHVGHQAMIHTLKATAKVHQLSTLVMLFEPQPPEFFKGDDAPPRISSWQEKVTLLRDLGVDVVVLVRFDQQFRSLTAQQFSDLLKNRLNARQLVMGDDFRFGCDRAGDVAFLKGQGFSVTELPTVLVDGERVSSTRIRQCLQVGDFALAEKLLGRPYSITGRIGYGDQIGRTINFPTANVALNRLTPCLHGIYATEVNTVQGESLQAVINFQNEVPANTVAGLMQGSLFAATHVGTRPAIKSGIKHTWRLEVHLPSALTEQSPLSTLEATAFKANIYGLKVKVTFLHFLHGEKDYPSLDALQAGIADDVQQLLQFRSDLA